MTFLMNPCIHGFMYKLDPKVRWYPFRAFPWNSSNRCSPGKWILHVDANRSKEILDKLELGLNRNLFPCILMGNDRVVELHNGKNIFCIFSERSDKTSVMQVLIGIRSLGITEEMSYKTDEETLRRDLPAGYGSDVCIWKTNGNEVIAI